MKIKIGKIKLKSYRDSFELGCKDLFDVLNNIEARTPPYHSVLRNQTKLYSFDAKMSIAKTLRTDAVKVADDLRNSLNKARVVYGPLLQKSGAVVKIEGNQKRAKGLLGRIRRPAISSASFQDVQTSREEKNT